MRVILLLPGLLLAGRWAYADAPQSAARVHELIEQLKALRTTDVETRSALRQELLQVGPPAIPALVEVVADARLTSSLPAVGPRKEAIGILGAMGPRVEGTAAPLALLAVLRDGAEVDILRELAADALARIDPATATPTILELLVDKATKHSFLRPGLARILVTRALEPSGTRTASALNVALAQELTDEPEPPQEYHSADHFNGRTFDVVQELARVREQLEGGASVKQNAQVENIKESLMRSLAAETTKWASCLPSPSPVDQLSQQLAGPPAQASSECHAPNGAPPNYSVGPIAWVGDNVVAAEVLLPNWMGYACILTRADSDWVVTKATLRGRPIP